MLAIRGSKLANDEEENGDLLYRGHRRGMELPATVSSSPPQHVEEAAKGASLENGLLHVDLAREVPEAMKSRPIPSRAPASPWRL